MNGRKIEQLYYTLIDMQHKYSNGVLQQINLFEVINTAKKSSKIHSSTCKRKKK